MRAKHSSVHTKSTLKAFKGTKKNLTQNNNSKYKTFKGTKIN